MIMSSENKIIKKTKYLQTKKGRDEYNKFIVEGIKFVDEIPSDCNINYFVVSQTFSLKNEISKYEDISEVFIVKDSLFRQLSDTLSPQGILAVVSKKNYNLDSLSVNSSFFLIAEDLQDPGNVGTLIRTADAAGVDAIFLSKTSADIYNPKVIRSTAGSIFHLPIIENADMNQVIKHLKKQRTKILAAHLKGKKYPYQINLNHNIAFLIGNEGSGLTNELTQQADILIKIPMIGRAESLNASVAAGILLYEVVRQRINNL